ncbi:glycosyltransferase family 2 protein [Flavobacterium psychrophilum]|uniref:Glycosyl transferase, group 2 family protein n=3 Tax=Flavobacterium psychrophilum TaxID=96345 RepID=A6GX71_FLAPJ|nr:glycosyltransferase family 2 protein [Flavobacterium psychrophilum]AIJ38239.1 Glycosyltransferase [Flavobacterium psychrophilum]AIN71950.1 glycosyl transferase family 2 [Flavobacterium psychrophilum FPG101]AIN73839.1 glycosyl transferase family 2 [Flavobacterium psychrophilum FPG3]AKC18795.1 glycosyl transferase family 2 [Flavobacterium psychrophilum]AKC21165.1 glycosyl transferase family 2 [Flavobacterium psychrophilum]
MQLSVIILNYNVRYFLELCVLSVQKSLKNIDAEIIVIDNNSSDDSCKMMKQRFPQVKLIENKENSGFPKGNNIGVAQAKGKYICILNPDTVVSEDTFAKTLAFAESQKNLGIVGCKLIDGTGNFLPESKRGVPTPFVAFTKIFGLYKFSNYFGKYYAQHLSENKTGKVDILVGAFMIMKRELYLEVGGFDEKCFMYSDDIDLSYMVLQKGKSNYYFHQTTVIHYKGESTIKDETYMKRFQEAMNFFYKKHFKVSLFFSLFMKTGIVVFSFIKMFQGKQKARIAPKSYVLISDNKLIKVKLQTELKKDVFLVGKDIFNINYSQNFTNKQPLEFIFDNNYINFKDIMQLMQLKEYKKHTFKILPQTTDYLIGSNSSNDRGGVILMSDFKN